MLQLQNRKFDIWNYWIIRFLDLTTNCCTGCLITCSCSFQLMKYVVSWVHAILWVLQILRFNYKLLYRMFDNIFLSSWWNVLFHEFMLFLWALQILRFNYKLLYRMFDNIFLFISVDELRAFMSSCYFMISADFCIKPMTFASSRKTPSK